MEKMKTNIEQREGMDLEKFKMEMSAFRDRELAGEEPTAHLTSPEFNSEDISEEDMKIYEKIQNENITMEEFRAYQTEVMNNPELPRSRHLMAAYLANLATGVISRKQFEEMKTRKSA